uniref:HAD-superfamily hydrolase, subfamily IA, variant 3 n=1 Tax=Caulobacter sp. (strain K31) TaxID=366602 RepID=B0T4F7_CAUSK
MPDDASFDTLRFLAGRFEFARLEALLFDMDGTLSDTDAIHRQAMADTFAARGVGMSDEDFHRHVSGQSNDAIFAHFFPVLSEDQRRRLADEKEALYRRLTPRMTPTPGLARLIGWAKARGVACALVTNGPRLNVEHTLKVLGLADSFDALVLGEDLPRAKPDPLPYLEALRRLGVAAERAVAFEDSEPGVTAALAAGVFTVEITGPSRRDGLGLGADLTVPDFDAPALWSHLTATNVHAIT